MSERINRDEVLEKKIHELDNIIEILENEIDIDPEIISLGDSSLGEDEIHGIQEQIKTIKAIKDDVERFSMMMEKKEDKIKVLEDVAESLRSSVVEARLLKREGFPSMDDESIRSMKREMKIFRAIICDYAMANIKGEDKK
jgi:RNA-binding protein YhbY